MRGVWTALITPFTRSGELDLTSFKKLLQDQKNAGITGVVPCGTTGESPTLSKDEKKQLIETAISELKGSGVKVMAGTGTNNTAETIEFSKWASSVGADAILVVTPYYNKPSQTALEGHFFQVAEAVKCGVVPYNVPGRTGVSLTASTIAKLATHPKIRTIKEATGNVAFASEIIDLVGQLAGKPLDILSGDDATYLPLLSVGAAGVISVASNLFPRAMVAIQKAFEKQDLVSARKIHQAFYPLFRDLFVDSNPTPIKFAMSQIGFCENVLRAPLIPLGTKDVEKLLVTMDRCGIKTGGPADKFKGQTL